MAQRITLYGPRRTPYTEKVRRALVLKGLDFELREPSGPEDYKRWSPETGLLPVLAIDSELVSDSTGILLRLDELFPKPPLLASDPVIAAQQRQLEDWADESFLWYWNRWLVLAQQREATAPVKLLGSRRFFYADQPSMADLAVYGMLFVLRMDAMTGSARLLASRPTLLEFMRRLEEATGG